MSNQTTQHHEMRLRSSGCLRWPYLPQEVRRNILNTIVDQRNPRWSALASVSKEWQSVIGTRNMAKLNLRPSCLEDFEQAVVRQRDLVRHIYLNIKLPEYSCRLCKRDVSITMSEKNERLMAKAVQKLFDHSRHLVLYKSFNTGTQRIVRYDEHDALYARDPVIPMEATHHDWHDRKHGWENGVRTKPPPFSALERLFGPIDLLYYIPDSNFVHIPKYWSAVFLIMSRYANQLVLGVSALIGAHMSNTLQRVILFQDSKQYLTESVHQIIQDTGAWMNPLQFGSLFDFPDNTKSIAQTSLRLNELSVSFFIDAMDFFEACEEEWTWDHLKSLSLTTSLLFQGINGQKQRIDNLLIAAARLVLRMPNLTTMVLWNGGTGRACAFIYTRTKHYAHITWRGTWDLEISQQVLQAWEDVAKLHSVELRAKHERLRETIRSHGDAILHLNLPCQVIEPTSLWQIRIEDARGL
ncbi:hypothetical protein F25303_3448 [Fusarium sp. NRRL 25303]|nr:hypothetical protein F25303_3448 [Fusarium sp. NRRL 25303]